MSAVQWHGTKDVRVATVPVPRVTDPQARARVVCVWCGGVGGGALGVTLRGCRVAPTPADTPPPARPPRQPAPTHTRHAHVALLQDVVVRVSDTLICGSDLHIYLGYMPGMKAGKKQLAPCVCGWVRAGG